MSALTLPAAGKREEAGALCFRLARVFFLVLVIAMPWEAVTAAREIAMTGSALFLAAALALDPDRRIRPTVLLAPWLIYIALALFSLFSAVDWHYSLGEIKGELFKGILVYYTAVHFVVRAKHLEQAWRALLWAVGIMVLAGVAIFYHYGGSLLHHQLRAGSLHNGYGGLGTYLVLVWPFVLLAPRGLGRKANQYAVWGLIAGTALLGYLTFSRAAWLGLLVETALCVLLFSRRRLKVALVGGALCAVLLGALIVLVPGATHGERWNQLWHNPEKVGGTAGDLMALWSHSWNEIKRDPLVGIGFGRHSFSKAYPGFRSTHQPLLWHAHNMFVNVALQTGVQGFLTLIAIMALIFWRLWPNAPPLTGDMISLFGAACAVMVIGMAVRNMSDDFFVKDSALMFWLLTGLALGARERLLDED